MLADVLAGFGDDGTKELFRRLLEQEPQDLIDAVWSPVDEHPKVGEER